MNDSKFKESLIRYLKEDKDINEIINEKIVDIISNKKVAENNIEVFIKKNNDLENEVNKKNKELFVKENKINDLELKINNINEEISKLNEELIKKDRELKQKDIDYINLESKYKSLENNALIKYKLLSNRTKKSLSNVIRSEKEDVFIACGVQNNNIKQLWEYMKNEVLENRFEDIDNLDYILNYFIDLYNSILGIELYKKCKVELNSEYDEDEHIRSSDSKASGIIKKVLLNGYVNTIKNKVEFKPIVKVV